MDAHPLDFDWRFTDESADLLAHELRRIGGRSLVIGAPTVWEHLARGVSTMQADLVERNPMQCDPGRARDVHKLFTLDICAVARLRMPTLYDACVFDPPWYIQDTKFWLAWALRNVAPGARIAFSLWPEDTRPTARIERDEMFRILEGLGSFELRERALRYQIPEFERRALGVTSQWRSGDLVWFRSSASADVSHDFCPIPVSGSTWFRFGVASKQIAIRAVQRPGGDEIAPLSPESGWFMKSVSRRDPMRDRVDLWTSDGFVARLTNPMRTIELLRRRDRGGEGSADTVSRTLKEFGGVDLNAHNSVHWTAQEWYYVN